MRLEDDIVETAVRICDQLASAVERYAAVSGNGFAEVPESFLRDRVFDGLGDVLTMTLETKNSALWEWNADAKRRRNGQPLDTPLPPQPQEFKNQTRPDLVIFTGDHSKKHETDFLCIVEIKKWWTLSPPPKDLTKISKWFCWLDTCRYGMLCAFVRHPNDEYIERLRHDAINGGHLWVPGRIARPLGGTENYQPFARIIEQRLTDCTRFNVNQTTPRVGV
jgi:hypothetical protein